ncbi:glutathione/cysteine ABC transporter permease/ATP-binding protein [Actinophytocola xanthii]|uniref:Glutathione/cysteine ABC transporter permease/ATP-binding protein n=1 Tax=Actinophytocola xanthii TaxID=1912961 RepID=A0A1Q8C7V1_9PSEU|nr:glutathione/cysteine ABC transporter permease/ATP-binding protein [Actinophytocola xanthii]
MSRTARRALVGCAALAVVQGIALVVQAWALASVLADLVGGSTAPIHGRLALLTGAVLARALLGWVTQVVAARAAADTKAELRAVVLDRALAAGPEWIVHQGPAELTALATRGLDALDAYFTVYLPALVNSAVLPLGVAGVLLLTDWPSAVVIALTLPLVPLFAALVGLRTRDRVAAAADSTARLSGHFLELVRALPVLASFRRASAQADVVRRVSDAHRRATMDTLRLAFASALVLELVATLSVALIAVVIGVRLVSGDLALSIGLFVLLLAPECYLPLRAAGAAHHASEDGMEAARRIAELPVAPEVPTGPAPSGVLEVRDLRVLRRDAFAPDGLSFTARPGEITHLSSPSGTGKSTVFSVLLGFTRPTAGTTRVGGVDLSTVDPERWRRTVAWVPQHPVLTAPTVLAELVESVADLVPEPPARAELSAAATEVATEVAAEHLLDRPTAELSVGERQRVAVARALLRLRHGATLLLLDEPTAHLDGATAGRVMAAIDGAAAAGATVVLASHRIAESNVDSVPARRRERLAGAVTPRPARLRPLLTRRLLYGALLGAAALTAGIALTATSAWLVAKASQQPPILMLSVAVVGVRAFGLARAGLRYAERLVTHDAAFRAAGEHRVRLWRSLTPAHADRADGLAHDIDTVRDLTPRVLTPPLVAGLVVAASVLVQLVILPAAALTLAIAVVAAGLGAPAAATALDRHAGSAQAAGRRRLATGMLTLLTAAADLVAVGAHRRHRAKLGRVDADLARTARREAFGAGAATLLITLATGAATVAGTWLAADAVAGGTLDPLLAPIPALLPLALAEVLALLPPAAQHRDALRAALSRLLPRAETAPVPPPVETADIRLRAVDARWPGAAEPVLCDLTLDIPHGTHVAVVGPSGVGKSSLLALLLGFLPAEGGTAVLPNRVAWCPQDPMLVSTTVRENLRMADPTASDDRLRAALLRAGLPGWVDRLDTRLDGGAASASGGEAQRLALARALLADADVVLLDEPTAHLDDATAAAVLHTVRTALADRTVVHVTHRPDEAALADLVLRLDPAGRVLTPALA